MIKCLYFSEGSGDNLAGEAIMLNANRFLGMDIKDIDETTLQFEKIDGTAAESTIDLKHGGGMNMDVMKAAGAVMLANKHFIVIQQDPSSPTGYEHNIGNDLITDITINE
tara:strand:+ start:851 stop:1180 length:330 start_codon:yes stop_codon:yes gene_type:complete